MHSFRRLWCAAAGCALALASRADPAINQFEVKDLEVEVGRFEFQSQNAHAWNQPALGTLDVILANGGNFGEWDQVCLSDGAGSFTCADVGDEIFKGFQASSHDVALGDVDGDGNLDAVFARVFRRTAFALGIAQACLHVATYRTMSSIRMTSRSMI